MHPVLFRVGPFQLRAYGLALALSFLIGCGLALRRGRARGFAEDTLLSLFWWIVLASVVGARLNYILAHPDQFRGLGDALRLWEGGLIQYGGMIAAFAVSWVYLRRRRLSFLAVADVIAPSMAIGEGITRIGCFVNGCCFGRACSGALSVQYPRTSYAAQALGAGVPVCPSQLYLSLGLFLAAGLLFLLERWRRLNPGVLFGSYLVLQALMRYLVDFTRFYDADDRVTSAGPWLVSNSQIVALLLLLLGVALIVHGSRRAAPGAEEVAAGRSRA